MPKKATPPAARPAPPAATPAKPAAAKPAKSAAAKLPAEVPVRLLVKHTGIGGVGDAVQMDTRKALAHQDLKLVRILDPKLAPPDEDQAGD